LIFPPSEHTLAINKEIKMKTIVDTKNGITVTQPTPRKKKQPPTLEQLTEQLKEKQQERSWVFEEYQKVQNNIRTLSDTIEDLQHQICNIKYLNEEPRNIDWKDLLMANNGQGQHNLMHKKWHELWPNYDMRPNGYNPETGQSCLGFHLNKEPCTKEYLEKMNEILLFIIPFLIPHNNRLIFELCEPGLSEFTSYEIHFHTNTNTWNLMRGRSTKEPCFSTNDSLTFLQYLAANHSFKPYTEDEDDYN
jgi:hypothetical protein